MGETGGDVREAVVAEARKALRCLYIAVDESVARDVAAKIEPVFALLKGVSTGQPVAWMVEIECDGGPYREYWTHPAREARAREQYREAVEGGDVARLVPLYAGPQGGDEREAHVCDGITFCRVCGAEPGEREDQRGPVRRETRIIQDSGGCGRIIPAADEFDMERVCIREVPCPDHPERRLRAGEEGR